MPVGLKFKTIIKGKHPMKKEKIDRKIECKKCFENGIINFDW